jgi:RNA binding exosome subunit
MTAREKSIEVDQGKIFLRTENDGWSYMRHGKQEAIEEITLESVQRYFPEDYDRVVRELGHFTPEDLDAKNTNAGN